MQEIIRNLKSELEKIIEWYKTEISSLRTGRATPALVEDLYVDVYGTKSPLKHIASISSPDSRSIMISPWDKGALTAIQSAIENSSLNLNPIADKDSIRLSLPPLTEERRKDLIKVLGAKTEDGRVQSRHSRDEALKKLQDMEKSKQISEDEKFRTKDSIQKEADTFTTLIEKIRSEKEKEIMEK